MNTFKTFYFDHYSFDSDRKTLSLNYSLDDSIGFIEQFIFDFAFISSYPKDALDRAFFGLFLAAGVSYFKTYVPSEIKFRTRAHLNSREEETRGSRGDFRLQSGSSPSKYHPIFLVVLPRLARTLEFSPRKRVFGHALKSSYIVVFLGGDCQSLMALF